MQRWAASVQLCEGIPLPAISALWHTGPHCAHNAPDLYIPLMAFVTYILVIGLSQGMTQTFVPHTGTGLAPATSAPGLGSPRSHLHRGWAHPPTSAPGALSPQAVHRAFAMLGRHRRAVDRQRGDPLTLARKQNAPTVVPRRSQ